MNLQLDCVALSLLPISWWRDIANLLRAGRQPADIFEQLVAERWPHASSKRAEIMSRAQVVLEQGAERGLRVSVWGDAAYPPLLAAIIDPPPALWTRGSLSALDLPLAALDKSRVDGEFQFTFF
jgi:predicted Rossmann fold nucleotide-binding protein DprA/Smf involved in DNA uptake